MLLPYLAAPASICAPHSVTCSLEVPVNGSGAVNFVLIGAPCYLKVTPRHNHYGESRAHNPLSLVLNPNHVCSTPLMLSVRCWRPGQWVPLTNALFTSPTNAALNYPKLVIMNGDHGSSQIPGAQGQHPTGSFVTANIFFCRNQYIPQ
jgi:hypothetical protein